MPRSPDPRAAFDQLPPDHAAVLRGVMCGFDASQIATLANVPVEAIVPMVRVALAKLDQGLAIEDRARSDGPDAGGRPRHATPGR